jgi:hypothetical protein
VFDVDFLAEWRLRGEDATEDRIAALRADPVRMARLQAAAARARAGRASAKAADDCNPAPSGASVSGR